MPFHQYLSLPTAVELESTDKISAISELISILCKAEGIKRPKSIVAEVLKREESSSTFIGMGIAIPHTRGAIKDDFAILIGRSIEGVNFDAARGALAHIIVLVIGNQDETDYSKQILLLSEIASCFKSEIVRDQILSHKVPADVKAIISSFMLSSSTFDLRGISKSTSKISDPVLSAASGLAKDIKAAAIFIFADAVLENDFIDKLRVKQNIVVVSSVKTRFDPEDKRIKACIQAPPFLSSRTGQLKIGVLLALSRNLISKEDRIVCISGNSKSGELDTIVAIDIAREYEFYFTTPQTVLPPDVEPGVLERILGLAGEIAVEGREGRPTGTIFVVGDTNTVNSHVRQLIINPFRGYSEAERNIMDPGLDETIKEFASIDGAFIITGDGIVLSAGSYLRPLADIDNLPSGLGTRHTAAAGITACSNALAIAVSESTGAITLFKNGAVLLSLSKPVMYGKGVLPRINMQ